MEVTDEVKEAVKEEMMEEVEEVIFLPEPPIIGPIAPYAFIALASA